MKNDAVVRLGGARQHLFQKKKLRYEFDKLESIDHLYVESSAAAAMKAITK